MNTKTVRTAFLASLPVMAGYVVLGIGFGILLHEKGYAWYWATLMSTLVFAGSMQYVAVDLLGAGANMLTFLLMTIIVNARHIFYGISMLGRYKDMGAAKPYLVFALTDETFSLVVDPKLPDGVSRKHYSLLVSLMDQFYWILGSTVGAIAGTLINADFTGIDFSMTALFVIIVIEQWEGTKEHLPALTGILVSLVCLIIFGAEDFLIPSMIFITILLLVEKPYIERRERAAEEEASRLPETEDKEAENE